MSQIDNDKIKLFNHFPLFSVSSVSSAVYNSYPYISRAALLFLFSPCLRVSVVKTKFHFIKTPRSRPASYGACKRFWI